MLVSEQRCDGADKNSAGADPDDRSSSGKERAAMLKRIGKEGIGLPHSTFPSVQRSAQRCGNLVGRRFSGPRDRKDNRGYSHGSELPLTRIIEK